VSVTLADDPPVSVCTYRFIFVFIVISEKIIRMVGSRRICSEEYIKEIETRGMYRILEHCEEESHSA
jgi:hypothetical protein